MLCSVGWYLVTDVSGQSKTAWSLNIEQIGYPETSVTNYQPTPRSIPEERRPHYLFIQVFWEATPCLWISGSRRFVGTLRATHPTIQRHIPEDLNPHQHRCKNPKSRASITNFIRCPPANTSALRHACQPVIGMYKCSCPCT
jgi:hypothetical protein